MKRTNTNKCRCGAEIPPVPDNETSPEFCSEKCKWDDANEIADRIAKLLEENAKNAEEKSLMLDRVDRRIKEADAKLAMERTAEGYRMLMERHKEEQQEKAESKPETKKLKIRVSYSVEIDPEAWSDNYGMELKEVREDVKVTAEECFHAHLDRLGINTNQKG